MSKIDVKLKVDTLALHGGQEPDPVTGSRAGRSQGRNLSTHLS
jgi:hypothetical protein